MGILSKANNNYEPKIAIGWEVAKILLKKATSRKVAFVSRSTAGFYVYTTTLTNVLCSQRKEHINKLY